MITPKSAANAMITPRQAGRRRRRNAGNWPRADPIGATLGSMAERTYWDVDEAAWVPSPPVVDIPPQPTSLEGAEEADVRSG